VGVIQGQVIDQVRRNEKSSVFKDRLALIVDDGNSPLSITLFTHSTDGCGSSSENHPSVTFYLSRTIQNISSRAFATDVVGHVHQEEMMTYRYQAVDDT
jgi:hypothetical protein